MKKKYDLALKILNSWLSDNLGQQTEDSKYYSITQLEDRSSLWDKIKEELDVEVHHAIETYYSQISSLITFEESNIPPSDTKTTNPNTNANANANTNTANQEQGTPIFAAIPPEPLRNFEPIQQPQNKKTKKSINGIKSFENVQLELCKLFTREHIGIIHLKNKNYADAAESFQHVLAYQQKMNMIFPVNQLKTDDTMIKMLLSTAKKYNH